MNDHLPDDLEDRIRDAYQTAARTVRPQTLRRASPMLDAMPLPRQRRITSFMPLVAAAAVIAAIAAAVAVPRLTGVPGPPANPAAASTGAAAPWQRPPFQVIETLTDGGHQSALLVEQAASGKVLSTMAAPGHGAIWAGVAATGDDKKFIVAAQPGTVPYTPTRLYTLTLSARGTISALTPLAVPALAGEITSLAASADGSTVAYTMDAPQAPAAGLVAGVIRGQHTRQWAMPMNGRGLLDVTLSADGSMLAFSTGGTARRGIEDTAWVLPASAPPGSLNAAARKLYDYTYVPGTGHATTILESALISPDGRTLYVCTAATSASGKTVTKVTGYSTAASSSPVTLSTWDSGAPTNLTPVGGSPLIWDRGSFIPYGKSDFTAYLIDPAARTRTTLRLRGIPRALDLWFAW